MTGPRASITGPFLSPCLCLDLVRGRAWHLW